MTDLERAIGWWYTEGKDTIPKEHKATLIEHKLMAQEEGEVIAPTALGLRVLKALNVLEKSSRVGDN